MKNIPFVNCSMISTPSKALAHRKYIKTKIQSQQNQKAVFTCRKNYQDSKYMNEDQKETSKNNMLVK